MKNYRPGDYVLVDVEKLEYFVKVRENKKRQGFALASIQPNYGAKSLDDFAPKLPYER